MPWRDQLKSDSCRWLLEPEAPGVRYLTLRDLMDTSPDDHELRIARKVAHRDGPIAAVLAKIDQAGFWVRPGPGYTAKYRSTVWALILLAQLGGSIVEDKRIERACAYALDHALTDGGQFTMSGAPSGTIDCLQGNLCWALAELGCDDPRLKAAFEWMARSVTGEGVASVTARHAEPRYYAYKCGPLFACGINNQLPCAWGTVKVMLAFSAWPLRRRTPLIKRAIKQGAEFLLATDPATAAYPTRTGGAPSRNWWKFGFPIFYVTDLLQNVEALVALGYGTDPRLKNALKIVRDKQDDQGRWSLDYDYIGKTWVNFGPKKQPNKWVTLRAWRVLKAVSG